MPDFLEASRAYVADNGEVVWIRCRNIRRRGRYIGYPQDNPKQLIEFECREHDAVPLPPHPIGWRLIHPLETK